MVEDSASEIRAEETSGSRGRGKGLLDLRSVSRAMEQRLSHKGLGWAPWSR